LALKKDKYVIDTDVLIDYLKGVQAAKDFLLRAESKKNEVFYSVITVIEIYTGLRNEQEEKDFLKLLKLMRRVNVDFAISKKAGEFRNTYAARYSCEIPDAILAATAYVKKAKFATRNAKHFKMIKEIEAVKI